MVEPIPHTLRIFGLALPNYEHTPASCLKRINDFRVPRNVPGKLRLPKLYSRFWHRCLFATLVLMPETAMHKNGSFA